MAIVKANYTKSGKGAKASIRYIQHRPGKDREKLNRALFGRDGIMGRDDAYRIIDDAAKGSVFFRFVISPDPQQEDSQRDLHLRDVTEHTMQTLEDRLHSSIAWVGVVHDDHTTVRHVHIVAVVSGRLGAQDFTALRQTATAACLEQRSQRDWVRSQQAAITARSQNQEAELELFHDL